VALRQLFDVGFRRWRELGIVGASGRKMKKRALLPPILIQYARPPGLNSDDLWSFIPFYINSR